MVERDTPQTEHRDEGTDKRDEPLHRVHGKQRPGDLTPSQAEGEDDDADDV